MADLEMTGSTRRNSCMKVLIFMTQFYRLNGAERLGVELAEELNKRGIHADILSMYKGDMPGVPEATQELMRRSIPAVHFLGLPVHPPAWSLFSAVAALRRLIHENGYTIVETSQVSPTVIASWAVLRGGTQHVAGLHHVYRRRNHSSVQHRFWRFTVGANKKTRFYAISNYAARHWIEYSRTAPSRTSTVYNGISQEFFAARPDRDSVRQELGIGADTRLILFVGRLASIKGIDTLLDAVVDVLEEENLALLYVGEPEVGVKGTADILRRMDRVLDSRSLGERVKFLGFRKDIPRLMASADVLAHPARTEGFGLVLAEAMAAGLPVVATHVDGIPEVLEGTESIMVAPDDPQALRTAILTTLNRPPADASRAIEAGRKRARDFSMERRVDAMIRLFEELGNGN